MVSRFEASITLEVVAREDGTLGPRFLFFWKKKKKTNGLTLLDCDTSDLSLLP